MDSASLTVITPLQLFFVDLEPSWKAFLEIKASRSFNWLEVMPQLIQSIKWKEAMKKDKEGKGKPRMPLPSMK